MKKNEKKYILNTWFFETKVPYKKEKEKKRKIKITSSG